MMFRPRRIFVILVTFLLAALCGNAGGAQTLRVLTRDTSAIGGPAVRHGRSFETRTGTRVEVVQVPFEQLYDRIMLGFVTGRLDFDVLLIPSAWLADFAPYLSRVPDKVLTAARLDDIQPVYRNALMRWGDHWMALTIDGDLHLGAYRRDLFEDPANRAAFQQRFGRPLAPPRSWREYIDIADFFSGRPGPQGKPLAGTLEAYARNGQRIWYLFSHAAAYANPPDHPGYMFFDPVSMQPEIDNPAWVRALEEYLQLRRDGPADAGRLDSEAVRTRFAAGAAAMDIDWADTGVLAGDARTSRIAGKLGFFPLPGSREVWNPVSREWQQLAAPRSVTFLAFGGWIAVVPAASAQRDLAWSYVNWYASPEHSAADVLDGTTGINPYRRSQLADEAPWDRLLGKRQAADYLAVLKSSLAARQTVPDLRIPGYRAYIEALERQLDRVLAGATTPQAGLSETARQWQALTDRLGRNSQRRLYRQSMGLPALPE
ncbi:MAG: extracellular solute-binding protein [Candidatus Thiodiazotropha sp.]